MRRPLLVATALAGSILLAVVATAAARRSGPVPMPAEHIVRAPADAPQAALDDATIVAIFDAANTADMETGALAAKRGQSKEVREFGAMLADVHRLVRQQGRDLATKLAVTPTPPADDASAKAHAQAMATLRSVSDAEFDRAFLRHEVAFHKAVIDAVTTTLLPAIDNAELRKLVENVAPAFQAHMQAAANIEKQLDGRAK
jgi:putative membrane protein